MDAREKLLLGNGCLAEFLQVLHQGQGGLAGAGAGGLVTFGDLSLGILGEGLELSVDFFYNLFHLKKFMVKHILIGTHAPI